MDIHRTTLAAVSWHLDDHARVAERCLGGQVVACHEVDMFSAHDGFSAARARGYVASALVHRVRPAPPSTRLMNHYGSDAQGLICAFAFKSGAPARSVSWPDCQAWLKARAQDPPTGHDSFLWLHFNLSDAGVRRLLVEQLAVTEEFVEALDQGSRSTRIEQAPSALVAVVNDVAYEFAFDPSEIATLWMQVRPDLLITARTHPLRSVDRLRQSVRQGKTAGSTMALMTELMQDQGRVLEHIVRQASDQVDAIEDQLLRGRLAARRADLSRLRRVLVRLERLLAPEPGALFRFMRHPPAWVSAHDLEELRQTSDEMALVLDDLGGLKERIKLLQEEIAAQASEQSNRSLFALTAMTVLALPINLVAGLFGMNVGGVPLAEDPHGFALVASGILGATGLAAAYFFARRN